MYGCMYVRSNGRRPLAWSRSARKVASGKRQAGNFRVDVGREFSRESKTAQVVGGIWDNYGVIFVDKLSSNVPWLCPTQVWTVQWPWWVYFLLFYYKYEAVGYTGRDGGPRCSASDLGAMALTSPTDVAYCYNSVLYVQYSYILATFPTHYRLPSMDRIDFKFCYEPVAFVIT